MAHQSGVACRCSLVELFPKSLTHPEKVVPQIGFGEPSEGQGVDVIPTAAGDDQHRINLQGFLELYGEGAEIIAFCENQRDELQVVRPQ